MMKIADDTFRWYGEGRFDAAAMKRGTMLTERAQRELAKLSVIQPIPQGKTNTRLFDRRAFKRASLVGPLWKQVGLSLQVAGTIIRGAPSLEAFTFDQLDPWEITFDVRFPVDPSTGFPPRRKFKDGSTENPFANPAWFDPSVPPRAEPGDYLIAIINGRYVVCGRHGEQLDWLSTYGELSNDMTRFEWWSSFEAAEMLQWDVKQVSDADHKAAKLAIDSPIAKIELNASLALRVAIRRLLSIDPLDENSQ